MPRGLRTRTVVASVAVVVLTLVVAQVAAGERVAGSQAVEITGGNSGFSFGRRGSGLADGRL